MRLLQLFFEPQAWASLLTLTALEIVLGVDNLLFVSLAANRLPAELQDRARRTGLGLAIITRLALLFSVVWLIGLTAPAFALAGHVFSVRDLILSAGGLFLIYKATDEIHEEIDQDFGAPAERAGATGFAGVVAQIVALDVIFSLDSVMTAVGMADQVAIMAAAVTIAVGIMIWASGPVARFVASHPTVKMLALSFLLLIGVTLLAEGFGYLVPKGFLYAAIGFSLLVEALNQLARRSRPDG